MTGPLTTLLMESGPRTSAESARLTPEQVSESDYALRFGHQSAVLSQLVALVDETIANIAEVKWDAPRLLERLKAGNEAARRTVGGL